MRNISATPVWPDSQIEPGRTNSSTAPNSAWAWSNRHRSVTDTQPCKEPPNLDASKSSDHYVQNELMQLHAVEDDREHDGEHSSSKQQQQPEKPQPEGSCELGQYNLSSATVFRQGLLAKWLSSCFGQDSRISPAFFHATAYRSPKRSAVGLPTADALML